MAVPSREIFLERFPELGIHPGAVIDSALAMAGRICSEAVWRDLHQDGVAYYAAHLITQRVREVGATIGQPTTGPGGEGTRATFYGQQYEELLATLPITGFVV